jgi:uncharacterized membrane protein YfcA
MPADLHANLKSSRGKGRKGALRRLAYQGGIRLTLSVGWPDVLFILVAGIFSGFLTVTAGAAVTVVFPVLIAVGLSADAANATSRFSLAIAGSVAAAALIVRRQVDWKAMGPLLAAAATGTICGSFFGARIKSGDMLTIVVATSLVSLALVYWRPERWLADRRSAGILPSRYAVVVFFVLCIYEGIVAVDSALLRLIALVYLLGFPITQANPIKLITGLVMFGVSSVVYARAGQIDWTAGAWLAVGATVGACLAVPVACSLKARRIIYRLLQVTVTVETVWLFWHWFRSR